MMTTFVASARSAGTDLGRAYARITGVQMTKFYRLFEEVREASCIALRKSGHSCAQIDLWRSEMTSAYHDAVAKKMRIH
ncbi:hypothetical protein [Bradyrhizobium japonicum]|uniref:hypothetical protein n=1 Tax=Bradyrhizobium japonicum TaxID=375 RepID=UPI00200D6DF9|nr:hypothetical protein [Bradyrhizobium japonicum]UQD96136.1 hypothetical protein JEY30_31850 [Bradyrhizobium japonicum]